MTFFLTFNKNLLTNNKITSLNSKEAIVNSIQRPSKRFALLFRVLFFLYPIGVLAVWLVADPGTGGQWLELDAFKRAGLFSADPPLGTWQRLACFGAAMLPGAAVMYAYRSLWRLFDLYAAGAFFEQENVACFRDIGWALMAQQILTLPAGALQTLALTAHNPEGERMVTLAIEDSNVTLLVVGLMIILISKVMDEGRKLQEEQRLTV